MSEPDEFEYPSNILKEIPAPPGRRSRREQMEALLRSALHPERPTRVWGGANLCWKDWEEMRSILMEKGLLQIIEVDAKHNSPDPPNKVKYYVTSHKGRQLLSMSARIDYMLGIESERPVDKILSA